MRAEKEKGFTLIELLVIISIIGFLAVLALVVLKDTRAQSRDTKRKGDLKQIQTALELYYDKYSYYPAENWCDSSRGYNTIGCPASGNDWDYTQPLGVGKSLRDNNILMNLPKDPINDANYYYEYEPDCSGQGKCTASEGCCAYYMRVKLEKDGSFFTLKGGKQ